MNSETGEQIQLSPAEFEKLATENPTVVLPEGRNIVIVPPAQFDELKRLRDLKRKLRNRRQRRIAHKAAQAQRARAKSK